MNDSVTHALARSLVMIQDEIKDWFNQPEVREEYERWLKDYVRTHEQVQPVDLQHAER